MLNAGRQVKDGVLDLMFFLSSLIMFSKPDYTTERTETKCGETEAKHSRIHKLTAANFAFFCPYC